LWERRGGLVRVSYQRRGFKVSAWRGLLKSDGRLPTTQ